MSLSGDTDIEILTNGFRSFPGGSEAEGACKAEDLPSIPETWVRSLGQEDPLEKEMATHCSTLAWKIPWTEEPGARYSPWGRKESDMTERLHFHFRRRGEWRSESFDAGGRPQRGEMMSQSKDQLKALVS